MTPPRSRRPIPIGLLAEGGPSPGSPTRRTEGRWGRRPAGADRANPAPLEAGRSSPAPMAKRRPAGERWPPRAAGDDAREGTHVAVCAQTRRSGLRLEARRAPRQPLLHRHHAVDGVRYPCQHKALIPASLFDRVQETLRARDVAGVRHRKHDHYLKGLRTAESAGGVSRSPLPRANTCISTAWARADPLAPDADSPTSSPATPRRSSRTCIGESSFRPRGCSSSPRSWKRRSSTGKPKRPIAGWS